MSFDQDAGALHQRAAYGARHLAPGVDEPASRIRRTRRRSATAAAPFEFSDFTYDSRTDLRRHHASYQLDGTIATRARGNARRDRARRLGRRAGDAARRARGHVACRPRATTSAVTLQHQALWSRVFVTAGVRFEHNESFGNATVPRVAAAWYAHARRRRARRDAAARERGPRIKEPTILQSFSPSARIFLGNPDLAARAVARVRSRRRAAPRAGSRARRRHVVRQPLPRHHRAARRSTPATFTSQYFNIGLTRARGAELSGDVALVSGFRAKAGYTFTGLGDPREHVGVQRGLQGRATGRSAVRATPASRTSRGPARARRSTSSGRSPASRVGQRLLVPRSADRRERRYASVGSSRGSSRWGACSRSPARSTICSTATAWIRSATRCRAAPRASVCARNGETRARSPGAAARTALPPSPPSAATSTSSRR